MIEWLRGIVVENDGEHIVLDVHGVGYGVDVPATTARALAGIGAEATLATYLDVKENALQLYGFSTTEEREVFRTCLGVKGVGPQIALSILSTLPIGDFAAAVVHNDVARLTAVPGIGKKIAERLAVELRDKMKAWSVESRRQAAAGAEPKSSAEENLCAEVSAALQALGCKPIVADRAASRALEILGAQAPLEELVREALRHRY
jgi:Holliday junction DNA helicase RuvA